MYIVPPTSQINIEEIKAIVFDDNHIDLLLSYLYIKNYLNDNGKSLYRQFKLEVERGKPITKNTEDIQKLEKFMFINKKTKLINEEISKILSKYKNKILLDKLEPKSQMFLKKYYLEGKDYRQLAKDFGLTYQRIHQLMKVAQMRYLLIIKSTDNIERKTKFANLDFKLLNVLLNNGIDSSNKFPKTIEELYSLKGMGVKYLKLLCTMFYPREMYLNYKFTYH